MAQIRQTRSAETGVVGGSSPLGGTKKRGFHVSNAGRKHLDIVSVDSVQVAGRKIMTVACVEKSPIDHPERILKK